MYQGKIRERVGRPLALLILYSAVLILPLWAAFLGFLTYEVAGDALQLLMR